MLLSVLVVLARIMCKECLFQLIAGLMCGLGSVVYKVNLVQPITLFVICQRLQGAILVIYDLLLKF